MDAGEARGAWVRFGSPDLLLGKDLGEADLPLTDADAHHHRVLPEICPHHLAHLVECEVDHPACAVVLGSPGESQPRLAGSRGFVDQDRAGVLQTLRLHNEAVPAAWTRPHLAAELQRRLDTSAAAAAAKRQVTHGESSGGVGMQGEHVKRPARQGCAGLVFVYFPLFRRSRIAVAPLTLFSSMCWP